MPLTLGAYSFPGGRAQWHRKRGAENYRTCQHDGCSRTNSPINIFVSVSLLKFRKDNNPSHQQALCDIVVFDRFRAVDSGRVLEIDVIQAHPRPLRLFVLNKNHEK